MITYEDRAKTILKDSIKSAIYIDENARSFYDEEALSGDIAEELSKNLYFSFKEQGISLDVHKYQQDDEKKAGLISYFTAHRDLVILDWKLKDQTGEEEALSILAEVVKAEHLHFCTIYTSESDLTEVMFNILSYFSSLTKEEHDNIKEDLDNEDFEKSTIEIFHEINLHRFDKAKRIESLKRLLAKNKDAISTLKDITKEKDAFCAIALSSISLQNKVKSTTKQFKPSFINADKHVVVINNTIITILNKTDNKADKLIENYTNYIINDVDSFNQLLGLELYNNIAQTGAMMNHEFVTFNKDALFHHRRKMKEQGIGHFFMSFMNEVFLEWVALSLRDKKSQLLEDSFLDSSGSPDKKVNPKDKELVKMNLFYNSLTLDKRNKILNFGDVFEIEDENKFLICITPLCDCLRPQEKTRSNFYFAEGTQIKIEEALSLGDAAFISYVSKEIAVIWGDNSHNGDKAKYHPLYIKPYQYKIYQDKNIINDNKKIDVHYLNKTGEIRNKTLVYLTTIKPNYAQRIANHAFAYPMRVGIDFVQK